jgi:hypothetical protein
MKKPTKSALTRMPVISIYCRLVLNFPCPVNCTQPRACMTGTPAYSHFPAFAGHSGRISGRKAGKKTGSVGGPTNDPILELARRLSKFHLTPPFFQF